MRVGTVKELLNNEFRVGLCINTVTSLVSKGHEVYIEKGAGIGSGITDTDYENAGAIIMDDSSKVWNKVDLLVKVKAPIRSEYIHFREGLILFCYLHLAADRKLTMELLNKKVTAIGFETIETDDGLLPALKPMSTLAGKMSAILGAEYLQKNKGGSGVLISGLPGVRRAKTVVVGAGNVGKSALETLVGLGARVTILDVNVDRLAELETIYQNKIETLYSDEINIERALNRADLVIGAISLPGDKTPQLIKRKYYKNMLPGSVIVDVAIDQGGSTEISKVQTHEEPIHIVDGILHYAVPNIPGIVPLTSTPALNNSFKPYLDIIVSYGITSSLKINNELLRGVNLIDGKVVNKAVSKVFNLEYVDIKSVI